MIHLSSLFFIPLLISHLNKGKVIEILMDHYKILGNLAVLTTPQNAREF